MECDQKGTAYGEIKTAFGHYLPGFHGNFNCRRYCSGGDWNGGSSKASDGGLILPDGGAGGFLWVSDVFERGEEKAGGGGEGVGGHPSFERGGRPLPRHAPRFRFASSRSRAFAL